MIVLGIDPGTFNSGVICWSTDRKVIFCDHNAVNSDLQGIIYRNKPDLVVVEMISSYGMSVGVETYQTVLVIGRIQEFCRIYGFECRLVTRIDVRLHICGASHAGDSAVNRALLDRYGNWENGGTGKGTKKNPGILYGVSKHAMSALAVALTALERPDLRRIDMITTEVAAAKREEKKAKKERKLARELARQSCK